MMVLDSFDRLLRLSGVKEDKLAPFIAKHNIFRSEMMHIKARDSIAKKLLRLVSEGVIVIFIFSIEHPNLALTRTYKEEVFTERNRCCLCLGELPLFDKLVCD